MSAALKDAAVLSWTLASKRKRLFRSVQLSSGCFSSGGTDLVRLARLCGAVCGRAARAHRAREHPVVLPALHRAPARGRGDPPVRPLLVQPGRRRARHGLLHPRGAPALPPAVPGLRADARRRRHPAAQVLVLRVREGAVQAVQVEADRPHAALEALAHGPAVHPSSALTEIWPILSLQAGVAGREAEVRQMLLKLPEVQALGEVIARGLAGNQEYLHVDPKHPMQPMPQELEQARLNAARAAINALKASGGKVRTNQHDVSPKGEVNGFTVTFEQTGPDRGTIHVLNDTKLHVAPLISCADEVLLDAEDYRDFVPIQGGGLLFLSREKDYKITTNLRKDITVRLRCIGRKHPLFEPKHPIEVSNMLFIAGFLDGVFFPAMNASIGALKVSGKISDFQELLFTLLLQYGPDSNHDSDACCGGCDVYPFQKSRP